MAVSQDLVSGTAYPTEAPLVWSLGTPDICTLDILSQAKIPCDLNIFSPTQCRGIYTAANNLLLFPSGLSSGTQKRSWGLPAFRPT